MRRWIWLAAFAFQCGCSHLLYYPTTELHVHPHTVGLHQEDVWFQTADGTKINGWYFKNKSGKKPKGLVVFFHGNAENLSSHYLSLIWIIDFQYDLFIFDYRGYGRSEGEPSPRGTLEDGKAALVWAKQKSDGVPLIVYGQSLGGAVALRSVLDLKNQVDVALVVADSTFHSYQDVASEAFSKHAVTWLFQPLCYLLLSDKYAPDKRVSEISPTPLLVIHGDADTAVDYSLGETIYNLAKEPKEFWRIPGGRHIATFFEDRGRYRKKFLNKLDQVLLAK